MTERIRRARPDDLHAIVALVEAVAVRADRRGDGRGSAPPNPRFAAAVGAPCDASPAV